jgi:hypothetical protein
MSSMFGHPKHHTFGYVTSLLTLILELISTQIVIDIDDKASYVICTLCAVASLLWYEITRAELAAHFVGMTLVTWYQSYFIIEHIHAEWWLESLMMLAVGVVYTTDYYLTSLKSIESSCPADLRDSYGYIAGFVLIAIAFIPMHGAGLFNLQNPLYLVAFLIIWPPLAYTESQRRVSRGLEVCLPHSAIKCLPLFTLSSNHWLSFSMIILINFTHRPISAKHAAAAESHNEGDAHSDSDDLDAELVAHQLASNTAKITQRFAANGMVHSYDKNAAGKDDGDVKVQVNQHSEDSADNDQSAIHSDDT